MAPLLLFNFFSTESNLVAVAGIGVGVVGVFPTESPKFNKCYPCIEIRVKMRKLVFFVAI